MTTPSRGSDRAASASAVSAAVLSVPEPGAGDEHDAAADALVAQPGSEVGQRAAALVEPHEQPAGALDEDDLRLGGDLTDPLGVQRDRGQRTPSRRAAASGDERVAQPHELVGRDVVADEPAHLVDVAGLARGEPGLGRLHHGDAAAAARARRRRGRR